MNLSIKKKWLLLLTTFLLPAISSNYGQSVTDTASGTTKVVFYHEINGSPVVYYSPQYKNEQGEIYEVDELQYFVSDILLHKKNGQTVKLLSEKPYHYVDNHIPSTWSFELPFSVPTGIYDSISFIFGLDSSLNKSHTIVSFPENVMFWPDELGGGYHIMKMNIKYSKDNKHWKIFNCHLGTGQEYNSSHEVTGRINNAFRVCLPFPGVAKDSTRINEIGIVMNIENWFRFPHQIDFEDYNQGIMGNQKAMRIFCENGRHVFSIKIK